ncbi:6,7-dimethyl-8-ribityllumazine synthase [Ligilactobacillus acidipiscis]|uniref:6,7-dimethyl-8-ribityllumazine synthase n=1 Tax=Ligilactobacillus acidipiscis TaxID=89059 RepID=UPI0023F9ADE9|nr:6,7-dimethyl-8-ribityllumazine synthase [Ligilactobacillus acidipiscis]WEV58195.1 6,7-dimethyl-8-ribityllumazine synthase [Ligilactobacillus acidipiscis]
MNEIYGTLNGQNKKIAIVAAQFNEVVTKKLVKGAVTQLEKLGVSESDITILWVPGAFEIPRITKCTIESQKFAGVITLGAVVRGETSHFDYVCQGVTASIAEITLHSSIPVMFGILTTNTMKQAIDRAGGKAGNKGVECANDLIEMINIENQI